MGVTLISPPFYAVTSKGHAPMRTVPFTLAKSDSSRSCLSGYSDHPNYTWHTESSRAKVRSLSAPGRRRRSKYSIVQQNDDQHREAVGEPKKASYRGTQVSHEVVMVLDFSEEIDNKQSPSSIQEVGSCAFSSRGGNFHPLSYDSIQVIKEQCEMPDDVFPNTLSFGVSSEINHKKLQNIEHLVQKLTRLNSTHDEAHTDYIASLCENTKPDDRYILEILLASGILLRDLGSSLTTFQFHSSGHPINPELFLVLEQTKFSNLPKQEPSNKKLLNKEKFHRKLIFDTVNEVLAKKLALVVPSLESFSSKSFKLVLRKIKYDSIHVIKDQCEMPDDVIPNTLSFVVSSEINHKKLQIIGHLVQKLTRLNSTHDEAHTHYIASLNENTKLDDRTLIFQTVNEVLAKKLALVVPSLETFSSQSFKLANKTLNGQKLLRDLCMEIEELLQLKKRKEDVILDEEDDGLKTILWEKVLNRVESWTDYDGELPVIALEFERVIFKDLVNEVVLGEASHDAIPVETHVQNDTVSPEPQKSGKEYVSVSADSEFNIDSQNDAIPAGTNVNYTVLPEQQMCGKESVSISVNSEFKIDSQNGKIADANPVET
ncbi:longifolia 1-like protein [Tanacetum coccineum]